MTRLLWSVFLLVAVVGCTARPEVGPAAQPTAAAQPVGSSLPGAILIDGRQCSGFGLTPRRCRAVARAAASQAGVQVDGIRAIDLLLPPTPKPGFAFRGGGFALIARIHLKNGAETMADVSGCAGIGQERTPLCVEDPVVYVTSPTVNGYKDIPCADENGGGCATPLPAIAASARAAAAPLHVPSHDVAIDHVGRYEVPLGTAGLPNGILSTATGALADDHPKAFVVRDGVVWISLKSLDLSRPAFDNYYQHGWWPGIEQAEVSLAFDIDEFEPGAVLQVRNLVVE